MSNPEITFKDHVFFEVFTSFSIKHKKTLEHMRTKHGPHRFEAAFIDTYNKVCIQDDGDLYYEKIQKKFIYRMTDRLKDYSIKNVNEKLTSLIVYAADKFGGQYTNEIKDLLHSYHVDLVHKGYGERKMLKELKKVQDIIDITEAFKVWSTKPKSVRD